MKLLNQFNYQVSECSFEFPTQELVTVQGDSFTIKELVAKMNQGLVPQRRQIFNEDESDFDSPDYGMLNSLDIAEKHEIRAEINAKVKELQEVTDRAEKLAQNKKKEQQMEILKNKIREEIKNEPKKPNENV